jgi:hypothetical protein
VQKKPGVPLLSRSQCSDTPAGHSGSVTLETVRQCTFGRHGTWQRRCVTMYGGHVFSIFQRLGSVVAQSHTFWDSESALGRIYFDPRVGTFDRRNVYIEEGRNGGGLCLACPIIPIVIFRPVKAKTISMPTSRNSLHLGRWESSSYLQTRSCGCE